jgi:FkbM family methyltransferase
VRKTLTYEEKELRKLAKEVSVHYETLPIEDRTVFDLGANVGLASKSFLERGAKHVVAVEPHPATYATLCATLAPFGEDRFTAIQAAVVAPGAPPVLLYLHPKGRDPMHKLEPTRGWASVPVPSVSLEDLLAKYKPETLKIDIEHGEYFLPVLKAIPPFVTDVAIEFHGAMVFRGTSPGPKTARMWELIESFENDQGFKRGYWDEKHWYDTAYAINAVYTR